MDYKQAGVDIEAGDALVETIKPIALATHRKGALGHLGGFGALFDPNLAGFTNPIIVTGTDGVGTKLKVAIETGLHDNVGIDLVAMCVNDLVVQGAEPLSFLDYFATGKLDTGVAARVIKGIAKGCEIAGCVLAGGETAEMPGMYAPDHYDLAGFAMGAVERGNLLPAGVWPGDMLIGLASSGIHSNGFSLIREIFSSNNIPYSTHVPFAKRKSFSRILMTPTTIYVKSILAMHKKKLIKAAAHITGGGLIGNVPRVIPLTCKAVFNSQWPVPAIFGWLRQTGEVSKEEMLRTFNCGIGMVLIVAPENATEVLGQALAHGHQPFFMGHIQAGEGHEIDLPTDEWWA